jgi:hypothetical protein
MKLFKFDIDLFLKLFSNIVAEFGSVPTYILFSAGDDFVSCRSPKQSKKYRLFVAKT